MKLQFFKIIQTLVYISSTLFSPSFCDQKNHYSANITMIGTGYVGLVSGTCFAQLGHNVTCVDIVAKKIEQLKNNIIPIYEPGLDLLVKKNVAAGRLHFTTDLKETFDQSDLIFIAVGTPVNDQTGEINLSIFESVVHTIASLLNTSNTYKTIVIKSTVPVGTGKWVKELFINTYKINSDRFSILSNPEFLREGTAIYDFMNPDRIIIGYEHEKGLAAIKNVYNSFIEHGTPLVISNSATAEMIKYTSNVFLATKICFINEIANLCLATKSDISTVALGIGLDPRIGKSFLNPGPGFGGSCLPKDTKALVQQAHALNVEMPLIFNIITSNTAQQEKAFVFLSEAFKGDFTNKTVAILGLAFKADTDDIRYSAAIPVIKLLLENQINVKAYDPVAMANMQAIYPDIAYCNSWQEAVLKSDAIIIMTEWNEFKNIDLTLLKTTMNRPIVIDMRGIFNKNELISTGIRFWSIY